MATVVEEQHRLPTELVSSTRLAAFFGPTDRRAQGLLPALVRRLIAATAGGGLGRLTMPAGDDIRLPGVDGLVRFDGVHAHVPAGVSVWEMGVSADQKRKADGDFRKRTRAPGPGVVPADATFVFVTPSAWPGAAGWAADRAAEGVWRDVRVVDGPALAAWLERAPAVAAWLLREFGAPADDIDGFEEAWQRTVEVPLGRVGDAPPALAIAGRTVQAQAVLAWLLDPSGDLQVAGESAEEVAAFVAAVAASAKSADPSSTVGTRLVFARSAGARRYLELLETPHAVVLTDQRLQGELAVRRPPNVQLLTPVETESAAGGVTVKLGTIRAADAEAALLGMGVDKREASRIVAESRGSWHALMWGLGASSPGGLAWMRPEVASRLAPLVLAGRWSDGREADKELVARLAGRTYAEVDATARESLLSGGPLHLWGGAWDFKAWREAWRRLAPGFTPQLLARLADAAVSALGARDPSLDLPREQRWMANVLGRSKPHSGALCGALARSLAMLGARGDLVPGRNGSAVAAGAVSRLLGNGRDADTWTSLSPWLPELAEAAPEAFLDAVERLAGLPATAADFLKGEGDGLFGSHPHVHLLWALERLCWLPGLLTRAVLALGSLAESDPGGGSGNRPAATLRELFLHWRPEVATTARRLDAMAALLRRHPKAGWACLLASLPKGQDHASGVEKPRFRDAPAAAHETAADLAGYVPSLVGLALDGAGPSPERWAGLAEAVPGLRGHDPELASRVVEAIGRLDTSGWPAGDRRLLAERLSALCRRHARHGAAWWALDPDTVARLQAAAQRSMPASPLDRGRWLFEPGAELAEHAELGYEAAEARLEELRSGAVAEALEAEGLEAVTRWADDVGQPGQLGAALGGLALTDDDERRVLVGALSRAGSLEDESPVILFCRGFAWRRVRDRGSPWVERQLETLMGESGPVAATRLALSIPPGLALWRLLEERHPEVSELYWTVGGITFRPSLEEAEFMLGKLLGAGRIVAASNVLGQLVIRLERGPGDVEASAARDRTLGMCLTLARAVPRTPVSERELRGFDGHAGYLASEVLDFIERHSPATDETAAALAAWEWSWLPVLEHSPRGLRTLRAELSRSPEFFVEALKALHRAEAAPDSGDEPRETAAADKARVEQVWRLLHDWRILPGVTEGGSAAAAPPPAFPAPATDGSIDAVALDAWLDRARTLADDCGRLRVSDSHIGRVLAHAPADADGLWPAAPVREAVERVASPELERGLLNGVLDRRGTYHAGPDGSDERSISAYFDAQSSRLAGRWPRTAAVLSSLARHYAGEAGRRDEEGRVQEFGVE